MFLHYVNPVMVLHFWLKLLSVSIMVVLWCLIQTLLMYQIFLDFSSFHYLCLFQIMEKRESAYVLAYVMCLCLSVWAYVVQLMLTRFMCGNHLAWSLICVIFLLLCMFFCGLLLVCSVLWFFEDFSLTHLVSIIRVILAKIFQRGRGEVGFCSFWLAALDKKTWVVQNVFFVKSTCESRSSNICSRIQPQYADWSLWVNLWTCYSVSFYKKI